MSPTSRLLLVLPFLFPVAPAHGETPRQPPRDLFGDPLPPSARTRLGTMRFRHGDGVNMVVFSPDGKHLASLSRDRVVRVWRAGTGQLVHAFREDGVEFSTMGFSPDGTLLAGAGGNVLDGKAVAVRLWELSSGRERRRLSSNDGPIRTLAFSGDGTSLITVSASQTIRWDVARGKKVSQWLQERPDWPLVLSPRRADLAREGDKGIFIVGALTGKVRHQLTGIENGPLALAYSADGKYLAAIHPSEPVYLWKLKGGAVRVLPEGSAGVALTFSPDGKLLATADRTGMVKLWELVSGKEVRRLEGYQGWPKGLAFSPDGKTLALAGTDSPLIHQWDVASGKPVVVTGGHQTSIRAVAISPQGLVATGGDRTIHLWQATDGKRLGSFDVPGRVDCLAFTPDGKWLAACGETWQFLGVWQVDSGRQLRSIASPERAVAFSPDGKLVASAGGDRVWLHTADPGTWPTTLHGSATCLWHQRPVVALAFSPVGGLLACADETSVTFRSTDGKLLRCIPDFPDGIKTIAFSLDGKLLAVGSGDWSGRISLWDVASGRKRRECHGQQSQLRSLAFAPDGRTIAAGYGDHSVRLWETATGLERRRINGHFGAVLAVAFAADGRTLASAGADTTALLWDVSPDAGRQKKVSAATLEKLWNDLGSADGYTADRAIAVLVRAPQASSFVQTRLKSLADMDSQRVAALLQQLDHPRFALRQQATAELLQLGNRVEPLLRQQLSQAASLEVQRRLENLLRSIEADTFHADEARMARAREVLHWLRPLRAE